MAETPSTTSTTGSEPVAGAWALRLLWAVLLVSAGLAGWLAWSHLHLAHGVGAFDSGCAIDATFDCDAVNTSDWSELFGVPISLYALPMYAAMAWFAWVGLDSGRRGARARGLLVVLAGWNAAVSLYLLAVMAFDVGAFCLFCMTLDVLHFGALGLVLVPPGGRKPAIPEGLDLFGAAFVSVFVMATTFQFSVIYAAKLDREAVTAVMGEQPVVQEAEVATERRDGRVVKLPTEVHDVPIDKYDWSVGPYRADVEVVEFADFECGYCRRLSHTMAVLRERYKDRVRFVFKHYPMDQACNKRLKRQHHPSACGAAIASICAHDQGKFEAYHDLLFQNQKKLERADLVRYAERLDLELERFEGCLDGPGAMEQLREDISHAGYLKITGTPRTYVNGLMFKGAVSEAVLDAAIRRELGEVEATEDGRIQTDRTVVSDPPLPPGPVDMVEVTAGEHTFWIDAVEATVGSDGSAVALARVAPHTRSWEEASAACAAAGKRMCTASEWMTACQGALAEDDDGDGSVIGDVLEGRMYPYGRHYREGFCHDSGDQDRTRPVPTGSRPGCRTPDGIYDLTGNVQEWVGASADDAVLLGGAWYFDDKASCGRAYDTYGAGWSNRTTGFRCCSDSPVQAAESAPELARDDDGLEAGELVATFAGARLGGGEIDSEKLRGKVTLLAFWASWCGPCRRELPALVPLYKELGPQGFEIVAVNVDREEAAAMRFLGGKLPPYPVLLDPEAALLGRFDVVAMPTSILVGPDGRVVSRHEGYSEERLAELRTEVEQLLASGSGNPG